MKPRPGDGLPEKPIITKGPKEVDKDPTVNFLNGPKDEGI